MSLNNMGGNKDSSHRTYHICGGELAAAIMGGGESVAAVRGAFYILNSFLKMLPLASWLRTILMLFQYWILFKYSTPIIYYMVYTIINGY
jgi:hypothetical protein